jgi:short-subunit dehydrogenase
MSHNSQSLVLKNSVALITGAASGIGAGLAQELAQRGVHLALCDLRVEGLEAVAQKARDQGVRVSVHVADVADRAAIEQLPHAVAAAHGALHILVNNAGVALMGTFEQTSVDDFEWLLGINLFGTVRLTKACLPLLRAQPRARIVNLSSVFGLIAPPGQSAYCASKFAVRGFSESLRHELAGSGVGVTVVHPGGVRTRIAQHARVSTQVDPGVARASCERFEVLARTSAESAARQIVTAIERGRDRLLIGNDARLLNTIQRIFPVSYWRIAARLFGAPRPAALPVAADGAKGT